MAVYLRTICRKEENDFLIYHYHFFLPPELLLPLFSLSLATVTDIGLPSISLLSRFFMASFASLEDSISTNPKPRLRPVSRSVITFAEDTVPYCVNNFLRSSSVV